MPELRLALCIDTTHQQEYHLSTCHYSVLQHREQHIHYMNIKVPTISHCNVNYLRSYSFHQ